MHKYFDKVSVLLVIGQWRRGSRGTFNLRGVPPSNLLRTYLKFVKVWRLAQELPQQHQSEDIQFVIVPAARTHVPGQATTYTAATFTFCIIQSYVLPCTGKTPFASLYGGKPLMAPPSKADLQLCESLYSLARRTHTQDSTTCETAKRVGQQNAWDRKMPRIDPIEEHLHGIASIKPGVKRLRAHLSRSCRERQDRWGSESN